MSFFPDLGTESMVAAGDHVRSIGWLHPEFPYTKGQVTNDFLARLKQFVEQSSDSADALFFGALGGFHTCEFCGGSHGIANFGVPCDGILFVAPEMVVHYIEEHQYRPPDVFVNAVMHSPLPESEEYQLITEPFWHLHKAVVDRIIQVRNASEKCGLDATS